MDTMYGTMQWEAYLLLPTIGRNGTEVVPMVSRPTTPDASFVMKQYSTEDVGYYYSYSLIAMM